VRTNEFGLRGKRGKNEEEKVKAIGCLQLNKVKLVKNKMDYEV